MQSDRSQKNIVVKDDLRAEVSEALLPVYAKFDAIEAKSERALSETKNLNERLSMIERSSISEIDRVGRLEKKMSNLHIHGSRASPKCR